jgi:hypothetical protein
MTADSARLRALLADPDVAPLPWQQARFVDRRQYDHMPESWKAEKRAEEALLIRPTPLGNAVALAWLEANRALIVEAVNALPSLLVRLERAEVALKRLTSATGDFFIVRYRNVNGTGGGATDEQMDAAAARLYDAALAASEPPAPTHERTFPNVALDADEDGSQDAWCRCGNPWPCSLAEPPAPEEAPSDGKA